MIQFNSSKTSIAGKNLTEAINTDGDIIFNESYIVVGESLQARKIHATYSLSVHGNIDAEKISVNGSFCVFGDIRARVLSCHGKFFCSGTVDVKDIYLEGFSVAESMRCEDVVAQSDLVLQSSLDVDKSLKVERTFFAGEGVIGDGTFDSKIAIVNEYFEFSGKTVGAIQELSTMRTIAPPRMIPDTIEGNDIEKAVVLFNEVFSRKCEEWSCLEEQEYVSQINKVAREMPALFSVAAIIDQIIEISYKTKIDNLRDYLLVLWANETFPQRLTEYETLEGVFGCMFDEAAEILNSLDFKATNICEFALCLYILEKYSDIIPAKHDEIADKIFNSIGLRYTTVKRALIGGF